MFTWLLKADKDGSARMAKKVECCSAQFLYRSLHLSNAGPINTCLLNTWGTLHALLSDDGTRAECEGTCHMRDRLPQYGITRGTMRRTPRYHSDRAYAYAKDSVSHADVKGGKNVT